MDFDAQSLLGLLIFGGIVYWFMFRKKDDDK